MSEKKIKKTGKAEKAPESKGWLKDEKFKITIGLFLIFFAALLTLAFVSYFFTWKNDQSFEWGQIFSNSSVQVDNWSGKTGAKLAYIFITKGIGIAAFSIPFLFFIIGFRLLSVRLLPIKKTFRIAIIGALLLSLLFGFLLGNANGYLGSGLGGSHGYFVANWLNAVLGISGTAFLLLVVSLIYIFFTIPSSAPWFKAFIKSLFAKKPKDAAIIPEPQSEEEQPETEEEQQHPKVESDEEELEAGFIVNAKNNNIEGNIIDDDVELTVEQPIIVEEKIPGPIIAEPQAAGDYDPTLDLSHYKLPPVELLEDHKSVLYCYKRPPRMQTAKKSASGLVLAMVISTANSTRKTRFKTAFCQNPDQSE